MKECQTEKFVVGTEDLRTHLKFYVRIHGCGENLGAQFFLY